MFQKKTNYDRKENPFPKFLRKKRDTGRKRFLKPSLKYIKHLKRSVHRDPYSTTRNSSANWWRWTTELNFHKVSLIQSGCEPMMNDLGYKFLDNLNVSESSQIITNVCTDKLKEFCNFT